MAQSSVICAVLVLISVECVLCIENYCSLNNFNNNETYMQFSKEATYEEFAVVGKFKGLHCCAKGYRSIEWYKDGNLYPWTSGGSSMIVYPESANQTVYTKDIKENDAGNYTCLLRNDSVVHSHTIHLTVFEKVPDDPKVTYISQNQYVAVGQSLRLFCEAFGGQVDLPDAHNEAVWQKDGLNSSALHDEPRIQQLKVSRENEQTFGTYLMINNVKPQDFGVYVCHISKPGKSVQLEVNVIEKTENGYMNPNAVPFTKLILCMSVILFILLAFVIFYIKYGLSLRVRFNDSFGSIEENDGKLNDVLIVYSPKDTEIVLGVLKPTLENRYHYKCISRELPTNINLWYTDLKEPAEQCRRIVAVLSPETVNNAWNTTNILQALKQLQSFGPKLLCISLKKLPTNRNEIKNSLNDTLAVFLPAANNIILWERSNDVNFWYSLRLRLPPKRRTTDLNINKDTIIKQAENSSRLTSNSCESLNIMV